MQPKGPKDKGAPESLERQKVDQLKSGPKDSRIKMRNRVKGSIKFCITSHHKISSQRFCLYVNIFLNNKLLIKNMSNTKLDHLF